jgi:hypothetical protein
VCCQKIKPVLGKGKSNNFILLFLYWSLSSSVAQEHVELHKGIAIEEK